ALRKRLLARGITLQDATSEAPNEREERAAVHPAEHDPEWMTSEQAAAMLGISVHTIRTTWVTKKTGPPRHRVQGHYAYRRSEVIAVRDARRDLSDAKDTAA
ncbi:MAG TPA: helix-turn-helix domain-containing protein, partial [Microlunatus sp.]